LTLSAQVAHLVKAKVTKTSLAENPSLSSIAG
jgi:hypothetical protein